VEVTLRLTVCFGIQHPCGTCDRNVAVWNLWSCIYGAPSLTRGRVCNLQCNHSMVRVAQNPKPYFTVSSETPPTWRARFLYLYPPGAGWPSYSPGNWVFLNKLAFWCIYCVWAFHGNLSHVANIGNRPMQHAEGSHIT
jgi:hypothetical protein